MESNKDEALRCLAIAQKHKDGGNLPSARKFCKKSLDLFSTPEALTLLAAINSASSSESSASSSSKSTSTSTQASSSSASSTSVPTHRGTGIGGEKRHTPEQRAIVKRVRSCKVEEYYEILALSRDCEEADIKKAYRKLALALHPDKNGAPGADEAFKMVSKAFQVLSDADKRASYDRYGSDPESRSSGMSRGSGFAPSPFAGGGSFQGEMSPEDLFNMFFGGGGGGGFGGGFGGGPVFTASFGPNGFRTTRMGATNTRERTADATPRSVILQLLPLILLFAFSLLSALPSLFSTSPPPDPRFSFTPTSRYNTPRVTRGLGVKYHVYAPEFSAHPYIAAELAAAVPGGGKSNTGRGALEKFESTVEREYTQTLYSQCQRGLSEKERKRDMEVGLFGIGTDWEKVRAIEAGKVGSCEELRRMGVIR